MFKLFKRKNEMKELKFRVAVLESQVSADKVSCGNCNKEAVVPLENIEFASESATQIEAKISDLVSTPAKVDELKVESKTNGYLVLQIDGDVIGKVSLEQIKKCKEKAELL